MPEDMLKQFETVTEILNNGQVAKEGQYVDKKTNQTKTWEKYHILTDQGQSLYVFGPVQVGDTVETWDDPKWGHQGKVVKKDKFGTIIDKLDEILKLLRNQPTGRDKFIEVASQIRTRVDEKREQEAKREAVQPKPPVDEWGNTDEYLDDEPINLADIPF